MNATGGFRRRATHVSEQRDLAEHLILLDAGDALVGGGDLGDRTNGRVVVEGNESLRQGQQVSIRGER